MNTELGSQNSALSAMKRKVEGELQAFRAEVDEAFNEVRLAAKLWHTNAQIHYYSNVVKYRRINIFKDRLLQIKASEERAKKAAMDAARLAEELRQEQEHSQHVERSRKALEIQIKVNLFEAFPELNTYNSQSDHV